MNKIPSRGVAVFSNRTVCGVFDFKPAMFGEKNFRPTGSVENEECGVWKTRSVENAEC